MAKSLRYLAEYAGLRLLEFVAGMLSPAMKIKVGGALGRFYCRIAGRRRAKAMDNVAKAYPEWDAARVETLVWENFSHLGAVALEFLGASRMSAEEMRRTFRLEGVEVLEAALAKGRGVLALSMHTGNWEWSAMALAAYGYPTYAIGRRLKNPRVDRRVTELRNRFGGTLIGHRNAVRPVLKALKQGGIVGVLLDQRAQRKEGILSRFFGRPVSTNQGLSLLALKSGAPVVVARAERTAEGHVLHFGPIVERPEAADRTEASQLFTEAFDRAVEEAVRARPEQWFWMHRRWDIPGGMAGGEG